MENKIYHNNDNQKMMETWMWFKLPLSHTDCSMLLRYSHL